MDIKTIEKMLEDEVPCNTLIDFIYNNQTDEAINYIMEYCKCDEDMAKTAFVDFKIDYEKICSPSNLSPQEIAYNNAVAKEWLNKPKCPTCSSTNVQKIGGLERAGSVYMFGIFSKKINKSFKCKNCGYTW